MVHHFWTFLFGKEWENVPLSEYCLVNIAVCGKRQLLWVQFWEQSEKSLLSMARTAIVQTPIYVGHLRHNTRKTGLTSHLSPRGRCKWMEEAEAQTKPEVSIYSSEGIQPGFRHCQRPSLWVVNESSSWIWLQYIPSPCLTSSCFSTELLLLSKPKLPVRMGVRKEIPSPWGRDIGWSQSLSPKYLARNLGGIPGQSKRAIQTCCLPGSGSLLIQHLHSPYYSFSSPLCHRNKKQPLCRKISPISGGHWFTVHCHFPANAKGSEETAEPPAQKDYLQLSYRGRALTLSPSAPPMPWLRLTSHSHQLICAGLEKWSRACSGSTFHGFRIQTWKPNLVCVRRVGFLLSTARSQEWSDGVAASGSRPSVENGPGPERELAVENPQFWWHLGNCPDLHGVRTTLVSYSSCSK